MVGGVGVGAEEIQAEGQGDELVQQRGMAVGSERFQRESGQPLNEMRPKCVLVSLATRG